VPVAWIEVIHERDAGARLADLYALMVDPAYGRVDRILQIHSLHPEGMRTHWDLYREVMTGTRTCPKVDREMIALVVSVINGCDY
jgi:alkylhydroperoxidase family enzyme